MEFYRLGGKNGYPYTRVFKNSERNVAPKSTISN